MKRLKLMLMMFVAVGMLSSCSKVPAGFVGVKYYLLGTEKGISSEELSPGRYYIGWNEELYLFPTFNQNKTWTSDENEDSQSLFVIGKQPEERIKFGCKCWIRIPHTK